jgi:hypothetical protein
MGYSNKRRKAMKRSGFFRACLIFTVVLTLAGCSTYERTVVPFKMPAAYPNAQQAGGATIAAKAFDDGKEAEQAFGFDIRGAGVLPVQVIFDNQGGHPLRIVPQQTLLVDTDNNLWPILEANMAYDRVARITQMGNVLPEAGKSGLLAGAAGAIIGAAIGIVSGHNVAEAMAKGAAIGAAGGVVFGGAQGASDPEVRYRIREDLEKRALEDKPIPPRDVAHGFIFFPGEAKKAGELRLTLQELDTGTLHKLVIPLVP